MIVETWLFNLTWWEKPRAQCHDSHCLWFDDRTWHRTWVITQFYSSFQQPKIDFLSNFASHLYQIWGCCRPLPGAWCPCGAAWSPGRCSPPSPPRTRGGAWWSVLSGAAPGPGRTLGHQRVNTGLWSWQPTYVDPLQLGRGVVDGDVHQGVPGVQRLPGGVHILQLGLGEDVVTNLLRTCYNAL